jgi:glycopeptide antibiotics resistance protein
MQAKRTRWLAACTLTAYGAVLIRFIVFKAIPVIHIGHMRFRFAGTHTGPGNFVPFKTIVPQLIGLGMGRGNRLIALVNLFGNIIAFMPIGLLAPLVVRSSSSSFSSSFSGSFSVSCSGSSSFSWQKALVLGVATGLSFEVMEVVFRVGIFDVDDVILNTLGVIAGYGVFVMFKRRAQPRPA